MLFKNHLFVLFICLFIFSASNSYAEKEYSTTETGCTSFGGTDRLILFNIKDSNAWYEIADEEVDGDIMDKLYSDCNCVKDQTCTAKFKYTTDKEDYRSGPDAKGLIRKFNSVK